MVSVMFVCLGNICRSPAGEGMLLHLVENGNYSIDLTVASSGIGDWHLGQLPDARMRRAAQERGITLSTRARLFKIEDFQEYDYILAADEEVLNDLYHYAESPGDKSKVHLITVFSSSYKNEEIPDPYYGGRADFDLVLDMLQDACEGLLLEIQKIG